MKVFVVPFIKESTYQRQHYERQPQQDNTDGEDAMEHQRRLAIIVHALRGGVIDAEHDEAEHVEDGGGGAG